MSIMPDFVPNKTMLKKFSHKGPEPWKIFASCVREAIAKQANFSLKENNILKERLAFDKFMNKEIDEVVLENGTIIRPKNYNKPATRTQIEPV